MPDSRAIRSYRRSRLSPSWHTGVAVCLLGLAILLSGTHRVEAQAQPPISGQFRAFWVDTYNTSLNTVADVTAVVQRARSAGANTIIAQVRRRGDAWYLQANEPPPEGVPLDLGFDALQELVNQGHAAGLQVHAFVVVGAIWSAATVPADPRHVFAQHGFTAAGPVPGRDNWLTRSLVSDGTQISMDGYRFGTDFWLDFGHPDAAAYTVDVLTRLVTTYDVDGLHLDRIQYPDPAPSTPAPPTPVASTLASVPTAGYNEVSLERYRRRYGLPSSAVPAADDPTWSDWRRAQVTALMRRIYLSVISTKPRVIVSAGVVASGAAPVDDGAWPGSEPYTRVFQDWRAWMEQGLLDVVMPLNFRAEHQAPNADAFNGWLAFTRTHQYRRTAAMGLGAYLNSVEGTLRQARLVFDASTGPAIPGIALYSMGAHNAPVTSNPFAQPSQRDTPFRTFEDVAAGLRTGRTVAGQPLEAGSRPALFAQPAAAPVLPWKAAPQTGALMGTVTRDNAPVDTASITIASDDGLAVPPGAATTTDGNGFYGAVDLPPGRYHIAIQPAGDGQYTSGCSVTVRAGGVSSLSVTVNPGQLSLAVCSSFSSDSRR